MYTGYYEMDIHYQWSILDKQHVDAFIQLIFIYHSTV